MKKTGGRKSRDTLSLSTSPRYRIHSQAQFAPWFKLCHRFSTQSSDETDPFTYFIPGVLTLLNESASQTWRSSRGGILLIVSSQENTLSFLEITICSRDIFNNRVEWCSSILQIWSVFYFDAYMSWRMRFKIFIFNKIPRGIKIIFLKILTILSVTLKNTHQTENTI